MKKAGRSLATVLLLFTLTTAAFAGQIDMPPAPKPGEAQIEITPTGYVSETATNVSETATTDMLAEFALSIWKFLPSLF
jgi:predicted small lipoprotein YifL